MSPASTSPEQDDFVLVGGHQDSWPGEAATDNAAGNACKMELARVFMQHRDKLRRGLTFGFWTAHETGTMAGSAWYADRNWDDLRRHCVAYLQIDQPAFIGTGYGLVAQNRNALNSGKRFFQKFELFAGLLRFKTGDAGNIASWLIHRGDKLQSNWISHDREDHGDC